MKASFLPMLLLLAASSSAARPHYTGKQVIDYAKSIDVKTLDPTLSSQRLEDWLQSGPPHARVRWTLADTCDNKPDGDEDYPLCAKIWFSRNGEAGSFLIEVGTLHKGIAGGSKLYMGILVWEEDSFFINAGGGERLSELPTLLDQPAFAHGVGKLYNEIVAHHPIGIPTVVEMVAIRPLLSKRLAEQLQAAKACEEDYFRQHQATAGAPKPAWLTSGLFSGDGRRATPVSACPCEKARRKMGRFWSL